MDDQELARNYAPILLFSKNEPFFPMDADDYIPQCSLHVRESSTDERMLLPPEYVSFRWMDNDQCDTANLFLAFADRRGTSEAYQQALIRLWEFRQRVEESIPTEIALSPMPEPQVMVLYSAALRGVGDYVKDTFGHIKTSAKAAAEDVKHFAETVYEAILDRICDTDTYWDLLDELKKKLGCQVYPDALFKQVCQFSLDYRKAGQPPVYYYRVVPGTGDYNRIAQYWFFYAFNPHINRHEADWEQVTIFFRDDQPDRALYSAHTGGIEYAWNKLTRVMDQETGCERPVVFVAKDSHANYGSIRDVEKKSGLIKRKNGRKLPVDEFEAGGIAISSLKVPTDQMSLKPFKAHWQWGEPQALGDQDWFDYKGAWGVNVWHSKNLQAGTDEGWPGLLDDQAIAWVEKIFGKNKLAKLAAKLGGPPVGPRQHDIGGCWADPTQMLSRK